MDPESGGAGGEETIKCESGTAVKLGSSAQWSLPIIRFTQVFNTGGNWAGAQCQFQPSSNHILNMDFLNCLFVHNGLAYHKIHIRTELITLFCEFVRQIANFFIHLILPFHFLDPSCNNATVCMFLLIVHFQGCFVLESFITFYLFTSRQG